MIWFKWLLSYKKNNMFSNLYYLSELLWKSLVLSDKEKVEIFFTVKNDRKKVNKLIKILEDEIKGWEYIKNNYQKKINLLWIEYKNALIKEFEKEQKEKILKIKERLQKIKSLELKDSEKNFLEFNI